MCSRDILAVFGVTVGKCVGGRSVREFRVDGVGSWMVGGEGDGLGQFGDVKDGDVMSWFLSPVIRSKLFHHELALAREARYDEYHRTASAQASAVADVSLLSGSVFSDSNVLALVASLSVDSDVYSRMEEVGSDEDEEDQKESRRIRSVQGRHASW